MKIGIMTFWWCHDNYGQLLQGYALLKYLQQLGHDAFIIRYNLVARKLPWCNFYKVLNPVKLFRFLQAKKLNLQTEKYAVSYRRRNFDSFRKNHMSFSELLYETPAQLNSSPPEADVYMTGSDQVWNISKTNLSIRLPYFCNFGSGDKLRIAYSASFGKNQLEQAVLKKITPCLKRYKGIAVREESGVAICEKCGCDATWVCDPVLLLNKEQWQKLLVPIPVKKKYIFCYMLTNYCNFSSEKLYNWASARNLDVVFVAGNQGLNPEHKLSPGIREYFPTIEEWLSYLNGAEYVITNSFHCAAFSALFEKKFAVIPLVGVHASTNTRLHSLADKLHIRNLEISNNDYDVLLNHEPQTINRMEIEKSKKWLADQLEQQI